MQNKITETDNELVYISSKTDGAWYIYEDYLRGRVFNMGLVTGLIGGVAIGIITALIVFKYIL